LMLGRGVCLAALEPGGDGGEDFDAGGSARAIALLSAAYGRIIGKPIVEKIERACALWRGGEKCLAQIHLALIGLPEAGEAEAYRLFLADMALDKGARPSELMRAMGFGQAARELEKYSEHQPRVPSGSGRESGRWTSGAGGSGSSGEDDAGSGQGTPEDEGSGSQRGWRRK
jgi:hypothetical protein